MTPLHINLASVEGIRHPRLGNLIDVVSLLLIAYESLPVSAVTTIFMRALSKLSSCANIYGFE